MTVMCRTCCGVGRVAAVGGDGSQSCTSSCCAVTLCHQLVCRRRDRSRGRGRSRDRSREGQERRDRWAPGRRVSVQGVGVCKCSLVARRGPDDCGRALILLFLALAGRRPRSAGGGRQQKRRRCGGASGGRRRRKRSGAGAGRSVRRRSGAAATRSSSGGLRRSSGRRSRRSGGGWRSSGGRRRSGSGAGLSGRRRSDARSSSSVSELRRRRGSGNVSGRHLYRTPRRAAGPTASSPAWSHRAGGQRARPLQLGRRTRGRTPALSSRRSRPPLRPTRLSAGSSTSPSSASACRIIGSVSAVVRC